ncbi:MAG TPA: hypothetical protein VGS57_03170 [Thermoanaerobaculia bacterium]|jgi:hypothetical protein|nr:hypothetical protein [Thermoanaerobaculia bacterium]
MSDSTRPSTRSLRRSGTALITLVALCLGAAASRAAADRAAADPAVPVSAHAHHRDAAADAKEAPSSAGRTAAASTAKPAPNAAFTGDRAETERLLAFDKSIQLTAAQEKVRLEALTPMAAPCCKQFSAATCCCRCNMMRARDGLAKHLIADLGLDAVTVRASVAAWHQAINPDGFTGDSCSTGHCGHAFADNGCGGMADGQLVF